MLQDHIVDENFEIFRLGRVLGCQEAFLNKKKETNYEICQMLVSGALDDTKTICKAGADIFANFGAEKP